MVRLVGLVVVVTSGALLALAQSSSPSPSVSVSVSYSLSTSTTTSTSFSSRSGQPSVPVSTTTQTTTLSIPVTTITSTLSLSSSSSGLTASATPSSTPLPKLNTKIDPAFGVLGALLILTGLPVAFLGHKNRWTSYFLIGFYTLALTCGVLIIRFGVQQRIDPPGATLRGMFVLSSAVAGVIGGGIAIFFWKGARYLVGGWGGFVVGLFIQCFRNGGLIDSIAFRYIMFIACAVIGFTLCTIKKIHYYVLLISTALVGSTAFMLGVDCFTTANLKEFYMWNLGFRSIFPKFSQTGIRFPVTQTMQIELGLMVAVAVMGIAVQLRMIKILQRKLEEIAAEARRRDEEEEARAHERFLQTDIERGDWEKEHPTHGRKESGFSNVMPLMKDPDAPGTPGTPGTPTMYNPTAYHGAASGSDPSLEDGHKRKPSGLSEFLDGRRSQSPGAIPALDLGGGIEGDVPAAFMSDDMYAMKTATPAEREELLKKEALLREIQELRGSIQGLKGDASVSSGSRTRTLSNRLSVNMDTLAQPAASHLRPAKGDSSRSRVQSMELSAIARVSPVGQPLNRPNSVPLQDDWDTYVRERKLLQPPSGVTPHIATSSMPEPWKPVSPAVAEVMAERQRREDAYQQSQVPQPVARRAHGPTLSGTFTNLFSKGDTSSNFEDMPLSTLARPRGHDRGPSGSSSKAPVTILPPSRSPGPDRPVVTIPRTHTFEELTSRHREKMRELQTPLSAAEKERADLEKQKARWERSMAVEREQVPKRQAERAAEVGKSDDAVRRPGADHARSLSADKLARLGSDYQSRRASTMKVEDWQKHQSHPSAEDAERAGRRRSRGLSSGNLAAAPADQRRARSGSNPLRGPVI